MIILVGTNNKINKYLSSQNVARATGIEPAPSVWKIVDL
jgi:hypothetical protein